MDWFKRVKSDYTTHIIYCQEFSLDGIMKSEALGSRNLQNRHVTILNPTIARGDL